MNFIINIQVFGEYYESIFSNYGIKQIKALSKENEGNYRLIIQTNNFRLDKKDEDFFKKVEYIPLFPKKEIRKAIHNNDVYKLRRIGYESICDEALKTDSIILFWLPDQLASKDIWKNSIKKIKEGYRAVFQPALRCSDTILNDIGTTPLPPSLFLDHVIRHIHPMHHSMSVENWKEGKFLDNPYGINITGEDYVIEKASFGYVHAIYPRKNGEARGGTDGNLLINWIEPEKDIYFVEDSDFGCVCDISHKDRIEPTSKEKDIEKNIRNHFSCYEALRINLLKNTFHAHIYERGKQSLDFVNKIFIPSKINVFFMCFGERYLDLFENYSKENILKCLGEVDIPLEFNIYTDTNSLQKIYELTNDIDYDIIYHPIFDKEKCLYKQQGAFSEKLINKSIDENACVLFLFPDQIYAKGSFKNIIEKLKEGWKYIYCPSIRCSERNIFKDLKNKYPSPRELVSISMKNYHNFHKAIQFEKWIDMIFETEPYGLCKEIGTNGNVMRYLHGNFCAAYPYKKVNLNESIDCSLIDNFHDYQVYIFQDSDLCFNLDISQENRSRRWNGAHLGKDKETFLKNWIQNKIFKNAHILLAKKNIFNHAVDINEDFIKASKELESFNPMLDAEYRKRSQHL